MAQLNSIVGSIMRDMVLAQHQANMYASSLSDIYGQDGALERFPLPGIAIGEMELDLHYGIESDIENAPDSNSQNEINFPALPRIIQTIADSFAKVILSVVDKQMKDMLVEKVIDKNPLDKFQTYPFIFTRFTNYISRKILERFRSDFTLLIDANGTLSTKVIKESVIQVSIYEFVSHKDLKTMLANNVKCKERLVNAITQSVEEASASILKDISIMRRRLMPSANVFVSSDKLAKLPSDCIQSIHLKLVPRDLVIFDDSNDNNR